MGFFSSLRGNRVEHDPSAVQKPLKDDRFWSRERKPLKAPKLSIFLAQDEGISIRTGSLTASLASGSRTSISTKSSSSRSKLSVSFNALNPEDEEKNHKDSSELKSKNPSEDPHSTYMIDGPSRPLTPHPSRTGWKLFRPSKKDNKQVKGNYTKKKVRKTRKYAQEHLNVHPSTTIKVSEEIETIQRKRTSSTGSSESDESTHDAKIKSTRLSEYRLRNVKSTADLIGEYENVVHENDEESLDGKAIPLRVFRQNLEQSVFQLPEASDDELSAMREQSSLTSFSLYSSLSSVPSDAKKQLDDDSVIRSSLAHDYKIPFQVSTEKPKPRTNTSSPSVFVPLSPKSTAVSNIENDIDVADEFLQSMLDEVAKDMEELQTLFAKNKSHTKLDAIISNEQIQNSMNADQSSQCSTASFDADDFAEDDFTDHSHFETRDEFVITTIVEEDEDGSADDPVEAALQRGRMISAQAEIESSKSNESDLTFVSECESKTSLAGSFISFSPESKEFGSTRSMTPPRQLFKSISWKKGQPEVHLFQPDTTKVPDIDYTISCSFDPSTKSTYQTSKFSSQRPVSILKTNSGREVSKAKDVKQKSMFTSTKRSSSSSDVSTNGSIISSASSETNDSVCYMLERLRNETERRRNRVRTRRGISREIIVSNV